MVDRVTAPIIIATIRGIITSAISFGVVTLGTFQVTGDWTDGLVAGGIAGLTSLGLRIGGEGMIDQKASRSLPPPP